jgi:hypothetical protein
VFLILWCRSVSPDMDVPPNSPRPPMKMNMPLVAVIVAGVPALSSAFTLDATGYTGGAGLSLDPGSVQVAGYGELILEAVGNAALVVNSAFENDHGFRGPSLGFDQNESIKITFSGLEPLAVGGDLGDISAGGSRVVQKDLSAPAFTVTSNGAGDGAGPQATRANTERVPELGSAMLGLMGTAVLAFRRR